MILEIITEHKVKSESKSPISYDITYRRYLITDTNEHISTEKVNHRLIRKLMVHQIERDEDWIHYHIGVNRDIQTM